MKKEILELVKSQNIIDIGAPAFLNINLALNNQKDLFLFQNTLSEIDLIENFKVKEFNNKFAYVNIKYYGKINKIKEKLIEKGIDINFKNNQWSARLNKLNQLIFKFPTFELLILKKTFSCQIIIIKKKKKKKKLVN